MIKGSTMKYPIRAVSANLLVVLLLSACGGGGGGGAPAPTTHSVTLVWTPNHEKGVNSPGGGYQISVSGQPTIDVPYVSGSTAPTSTTVSLNTGTYTVTARAYAALDAQGGSTGSLSAASPPITVNVP
jgi:hypothetical protein